MSKQQVDSVLDVIIAGAKSVKMWLNEPKSTALFFYLTVDDAKRLLTILEGCEALPELRKQIKLGLKEMEKE